MKNRALVVALIAGLTFAAVGHVQTSETDAELVGTWTITGEGRRGPAQSQLVIERTDAGYAGTMRQEGRDARELRNIAADGDDFSFEITARVMGMSIDLFYRGSVSGDSMGGLIDTPRGERPFTGVRLK